MLSDKEKKAIERAEFLIKIDTYLEKEMLTNLLNLIEKQSKEIEELKDKNKKLKDKAKELIFEKQELTSALLDSTPNDKIKAKIEEKFLEAKGLYERGVQPQAQYTMKLLRDLEKSLLEKE